MRSRFASAAGGLAGPARLPPDDGGADLRAVALGQLAPWFGFRGAGTAAAVRMARLNARHPAAFILDIADGGVRLCDKPGHYRAAEIAGAEPPSDNRLDRAHLHRAFIAAVVRKHGFDRPLRLAFFVDDRPPSRAEVPLFTFQKPRGSPLVLWPDIEFLRHDFYAHPRFDDPFTFEQKADRAIFVGSTSGLTLTPESVRGLASPRLRAAVHFRDSPRVSFVLPEIVMCTSPEAGEAVAALGVGGRRHTWREKYAHRYLIAMDGNGPSCSRVALGLRSNGVLMMYESPHQLYFFDRLLPWRHYIPIARDEDVTRAMDLCAARPDVAAGIAEAGRAFHAAWLDRPRVESYAFELLRAYAECCSLAGD